MDTYLLKWGGVPWLKYGENLVGHTLGSRLAEHGDWDKGLVNSMTGIYIALIFLRGKERKYK